MAKFTFTRPFERGEGGEVLVSAPPGYSVKAARGFDTFDLNANNSELHGRPTGGDVMEVTFATNEGRPAPGVTAFVVLLAAAFIAREVRRSS